MTSIHHVAKSGFGVGTNELYDRARPSYQPFALDFIRKSLKATKSLNIVELGSGTGIFTRALLADPEWNASILHLKAIEPSEGMRNVFSQTVKDERISVSDGTFSVTGVDDSWADLVVIAQAFHWCPDYNAASVEFSRILKPHGAVAFIWNLEDREGARWVSEVRDIIEAHEQGTPQFRRMLWRQTFSTPAYQSAFDPPEEKIWDYKLQATVDSVIDRASRDMLYAKTDEMSVSFYANLPLEVKQVLKTSDFNKDLYSGEIDTVTGFALVTSVQTCFVWQHAQALKGIPTCYIFASPYDHRTPRPPFHALVPQGLSREPGLVLVSAVGQVRFWDSIGSGLAGGDNFVGSQLDEMVLEEEVTNLVRADAQTYILSTSFGRLYRLLLSSTGGKSHLTCHPFARPTGSSSFSRLLPSFFASASSSSYEVKDKSKHIHAVALGLGAATGDRDVWVLANGHIQLWSVKGAGWEELVLDYDLSTRLATEVKDKFKLDDCQDIELSDLAVFNDGNVAVLLSYSGKEESNDFHRLYALVELSRTPQDFTVVSIKSVPYQTTSRPGPPVHPRIQLIFAGSIVSVQFGDAVALCARVSEYRDRLELKSHSDRTLGVGVSLSTNVLLILTATTMMKVTLDFEKIQSFIPETGRAHLIKSIMMQAILYGSSPLNPLRFSFPPELNAEALMQGAEQLSQAVLKSDPEVVRQSHDLTVQLTGRKERLSWLIGFINENGVLVKMAQRSRQKLATDAEQLYACNQLWLSYNQHISSSSSQSILKDAVVAYMEELDDGPHEDVMRAFFRFRVRDIGKLLKKVLEVVMSSSRSVGGRVAHLLPEANRIVLAVVRSAFQYRAYNLAIYGIVLPMENPWTSMPAVIDTVQSLFDLTTKTVEPSHGSSIRGNDKEPSVQLPKLAAILFESIKERLDWLASMGKEVQHEMEELQQKFATLRPEVLETLRRCGHEESAYALAEKYQDFATLVALCHKDTVYPPQDNPHAERIQSYIQRFKEDFTTELCQWYIQHGEVRVMFDEEAHGGGYLDAFFREKPNIAISWIHDLGKERFGYAASALLQNAKSASNLEGKHLMLSVGKLAYLAQSQETNILTDQSDLDAFHDELDFVSVHEGLLQEFRTALQSVRTRSLDGQIDAICKAKATRLVRRVAFTHKFRDCLRQLLQGKSLSIEDVVDLLTLKDNSDSVEDYATSLHLLSRVKGLPEARKTSALRTVWRRVYLHDDWDTVLKTADVSDAEINSRYQGTALYLTLCSVMQRDSGPIIPPDEALMLPTMEEIVSRWPGMSSEQVDSLINDYTFEQDKLGEFKLEDVYVRIHELAAYEVEWEEGQ
ncbi:methyltransferase type 11 [Crassisporium funariophilum]|nr:methyltransferase type 11 [Crassisporium funariophilum]